MHGYELVCGCSKSLSRLSSCTMNRHVFLTEGPCSRIESPSGSSSLNSRMTLRSDLLNSKDCGCNELRDRQLQTSRAQHGFSCRSLRKTFCVNNVRVSTGIDSNASGTVRMILKYIHMPAKLRSRECRQTGKHAV